MEELQDSFIRLVPRSRPTLLSYLGPSCEKQTAWHCCVPHSHLLPFLRGASGSVWAASAGATNSIPRGMSTRSKPAANASAPPALHSSALRHHVEQPPPCFWENAGTTSAFSWVSPSPAPSPSKGPGHDYLSLQGTLTALRLRPTSSASDTIFCPGGLKKPIKTLQADFHQLATQVEDLEEDLQSKLTIPGFKPNRQMIALCSVICNAI